MPQVFIKVFERDLIIGNTTTLKYWSPTAKDIEGDSMTIQF